MKHITSRLLALLLTVAMIVSIMPAVYAADEDVTIVENEQPTVEEPIVENSTEDTAEDTTVEPAKAAEANLSEGTTEGATTNVAKVGETSYANLADAIAAAADGDTVTLLADTIEDVTINNNITLDLSGKTLTGKGTASTATLTIAKGATATVKNGTVNGTANAYYNIQNNGTATFEDVTATAGNTGSSMIDNYGDLTITSGDYSGGLNVVKSEEGSTLTINGGKFTLNYATNGYTGVIFAYGTTTITGGEFIQSLTTAGRWDHPTVILTGVVEGYKAITKVTGGTFTNNKSGEDIFRGAGKGTSDNFEVSGGTYNKSVSDGFFKDGYFAKKVDGVYKADGPYVARVNSTDGYATLPEAIVAAKAGDTVALLVNTTVTEPIVVDKAITLDLGYKTLTSTWVMPSDASGAGRYALVNNAKMTMQHGTFAVGQARGIGAYAGLTLSGITVTQELTGGHACVAFCKGGATYEIKSSTKISGDYAVANFANNANITINSATLEGKTCGLYHNGSNYGLKLKVTGTTINGSLDGTIGSENDPSGVYISGSASHGTMQNATFTNCTIKGATAIEVKYTDLTLDKCTVEATVKTPSYGKNSNGMTALGFAVVSTDNSKDGETPAPTGTVTIKGKGNYKGLVGLGALESVKTNYTDFKDETIKVSGGTFTSAVLPEYCADGFVPTQNEDGTYGVKVDTSVAEVNGTKYESLAEAIAAANAGDTIKLLADLTETDAKDAAIVYDLTGKTLDLNSFTYSHNNFAHVFEGTGGTIKNGKMVCLEGISYALFIGNDGNTTSFTVDGVELTGGINIFNASGVVLKNLTVNGSNYYAVWLDENAAATIESGTYNAGDKVVFNAYKKSALTVTGGTINTNGKGLMGTSGGTLSVSGGTFDAEVPENCCATGYVPQDNGDGTFGVQEYKPIEVWTGYSGSTGSKVESYTNLADAAKNLGNYQWILVANNYTLNENFTIPKDVRLDIKGGATLTVAEGATLTVAANAKRLAVLTDGSIVNNGTIMVCGTSRTNGYVMVQDGAIFDVNTLSVPEGHFLDNNGSNYFATANANALYEITYTDGTVKKTADRSHVNENATQVKLLKDVEVGSWTLLNAADNFVLDLGGHTLSGSRTSGYYVLYAGVNMTIKNGTIKYNAGSDKGAICVYNGATVTIDSTATIDGGSGIGIMMQGETPSHVVLNGTVTTTGAYGFASNGSANSDGKPDTCNITVNTGAKIEASNGFAIYHPTLGTVAVNGGTISGHTGIELCAGKLVVSGGSITSTGNNVDATGSQNAILDGAAISIINRNYPGGTPTAEITGGTIKATGTGMTVKAYDYTGNTVAEWSNVSESVNISGGTFSSAVLPEYCAEGYIPQDNGNGTYGVTLAPPAPSGGSSASVGRPSVREDAGQSQTAAEQTHFIDVLRDSWYYSSVYRAHENGLIDGVGGRRFAPDATLTVAQAIKLSAALHQLDRTGEVSLKNGAGNWYDAYVSYAIANGILEERYAGYSREQMNAPVTRSEFVRILHGALEHYEQINTVADNAIPDVKLGDAFAAAIYELYRAGILHGNDAAGTFRPESTIKRSEAAAILLRMFEPSERKSFTLGA